jgi:hypothetical protein
MRTAMIHEPTRGSRIRARTLVVMIAGRVSGDAVLLAVLTASGLGFGGTGIAAGAEAAPTETRVAQMSTAGGA